MRTFSPNRAHQSTVETFNTSLWRRKTKPASVNYFAIVVLATNKTCGTFPWEVSVFSVLWNIMLKKLFWLQCQKETVSYFNQSSRIFSGTLTGQRDRRPISLPPVIASAMSSIVFFDDASWCSSATALLALGLFSSLRRSTVSLSQHVLRYSVLNKWCFGHLNILNLLIKSNQKWLQISNRVRSENFQNNVSEQQLASGWTWSTNVKLGAFEACLAN